MKSNVGDAAFLCIIASGAVISACCGIQLLNERSMRFPVRGGHATVVGWELKLYGATLIMVGVAMVAPLVEELVTHPMLKPIAGLVTKLCLGLSVLGVAVAMYLPVFRWITA